MATGIGPFPGAESYDSPSGGRTRRSRGRRKPSKSKRDRIREITRAVDRWERLVRSLAWARDEYFPSPEVNVNTLSHFLLTLGRI